MTTFDIHTDRERKFRVLMVCLGNICRSPAAHHVMEHLIAQRRLSDVIEVDSAGTYGGHAGDLPDPRKPKGRFFWFTFGICMVRIRYADQKLLCLQWKCGLGLEMALSVDARRGSAPCRWAFPGVLFIIKKMLERNFCNFEKKIILTTKTIPTMQRNKKTFK